jgi:hypothetical protein
MIVRMRTCKRCNQKNIFDNRRICIDCMKEWTNMRSLAWNSIEVKIGKLNPLNHETYKKEMKRLENIWKKDKEKFKTEIQ